MNDIHGYVGAYVTDALDEELRIVFAEHLPDCESCSREVREFAETLARLSDLSATPPPPALRDDVLGAIRRVRIEPPEDSEQNLPAPPPELRRNVLAAVANPATEPDDPKVRARRRPWWHLAVAASLVLAVLFGGWAMIQQQRIDQIEQAQNAARPVTELLQAADLRTYPFTWPDGNKGAYLVSRQLNRAMITGAVPTPDPGRTFQLWSMRGPDPTAGPTFHSPGSGVWNVDLSGVDALAISSEPTGGSAIPTVVLTKTKI